MKHRQYCCDASRDLYEEYYSESEVFIACPTCLRFLCFDHKDSGCVFHTGNIPEIDTHASPRAGSHFVIVVDDATGEELKVPV